MTTYRRGLIATSAALALAASGGGALAKSDKSKNNSGGGVTVVKTNGAAPTLASPCVSVLSGCVFSKNDNEMYASTIQALYNAQAPTGAPTIATLAFFAKSGAGGAGLVGSSGVWTTAAPVDFVSVKAGDGFFFYQLDKPATSGTWSTAALGGKDLSHLSFWTGLAQKVQAVDGGGETGGGRGTDGDLSGVAPVPEPATWAMLIGGMALVGASLRRRRAGAVRA